jgi:hypothetical protein
LAEPFTCHHTAKSLKPIAAGWALDHVSCLDQEYPGFLRYMLGASGLRRQGIFFALAQAEGANLDWLVTALSVVAREKAPAFLSPIGALGFYLCSLRVRRIIQAIHCKCPQGLVGTLAKVGENPLPKEKYASVFRVLNDPAEQARGDLLRSEPKVTASLLDVIERLPPHLLHPGVLGMCSRPAVIARVDAAVAVAGALNPEVKKAEIIVSLTDMADKGLVGFIEHWIERSERLVATVPPVRSDRLRCLETAAALRDASKRYRNCLKHKIGEVALDHALFFELVADDPHKGAIAEVTPLSCGKFLLAGIHGYANGKPPKEAVIAILDDFASAGVLFPSWVHQDDTRYNVRQTLRLWEFRDHGTLDPRELANEPEPDDMPTPFDPEAAGLVRVA